jgi:hypothetical protein
MTIHLKGYIIAMLIMCSGRMVYLLGHSHLILTCIVVILCECINCRQEGRMATVNKAVTPVECLLRDDHG